MGKNYELAINLANWLVAKIKGPVDLEVTDDGAVLITYYSNRPAVRICDSKVIWPKGSDADFVMDYMTMIVGR